VSLVGADKGRDVTGAKHWADTDWEHPTSRDTAAADDSPEQTIPYNHAWLFSLQLCSRYPPVSTTAI
jgi:hypothetical protein